MTTPFSVFTVRNSWMTEQTMVAVWADLEKSLAFYEQAFLTGINIKHDEDGWFIIIKAHKDGQDVVSFTGCRYFQDIPEILAYEITHAGMGWRPDKYAKKV